MSKKHILALMLITLMAFSVASAQTPKNDGWIKLFNGENLDGWKISKENPSTFSINSEGAIVAKGPRAHLFYDGPVNGANFKNFEFKVDVMTKPGSNGGLFFHTQYQDSGWPSHGFEAQVNKTFTPDPRKTGSLYRVQDVPVALHEDNEWFTEHIIVKGERVVIKINGKTVVDWTQEPDAGKKLSSGTFALQGHDPGSTAFYKEIYVKPLPDDVPSYTAPNGWQDLFDGLTLDGWEQKNGTAKYVVEDGAIKGTTVKGSPNSFLCSRPYRNFELEFEVMLDSRLNSGVQIRSNSYQEYRKGRVHGYQVEIATNGTAGNIYDEARRGWLSPETDRNNPISRVAFKKDLWNKYRVVCASDTIRTWVNSIPVTDITDSMTGSGFIGLQVHGFRGDSPAWVKWRNIRIKALRSTKWKPIKVVVVTGGHGFEREPFFKMFDDMRYVDYVEAVQKDHSELFEDIGNWDYEVIVFYNMTQKISEKRRANFVKLLQNGVGVVALHHTLGAYQEWPEFKNIIGGKYYTKDTKEGNKEYKKGSYKHDVDMNISVNQDHLFSSRRAMSDFTIHDETYKGVSHLPDNQVWMTCNNPTSDEQIAWTRTYKNARICTIQLGHDGKSYSNENFRRAVGRALFWTSQR